MTGRRNGLALSSAVNNLAGALCHPCDKSRIYFTHCCLLGSKSTADPRLFCTDHGFGDSKSIGKNTSDMKYDLCGTDTMKSSVPIDLTISTDCLHIPLLSSFNSPAMLNNFFTICKYRFHISMSIFFMMQKIAFHISRITMGHPVVFRMNQHRVIQCFSEIKHRLQHLILHFNDTQCFVHCFFCLTGYNRNRISYTSDSLIKNQTIIGRWLWESLSSNRESPLRHILPCIDSNNPWHLHSSRRIDLFDNRMRMRAAQ